MKDKFSQIYKNFVVFKDWYKTVYPFNRYFTGAKVLHLRNGMEVSLPAICSFELFLITSYFYDDEYKVGNISLPPNPTIVDLGANIGLFSIDAKSHFPGATIIAYEPHPETFELLKKNIPFAKTIQRAAAGESGTVYIQIGGKSTHRKLVVDGGVEVKADNLDTILANLSRVDLLKVDVEGSEFALFENASEQTLQKIQKILIEIHGDIIGTFVNNGKVYDKRTSKNKWVEDFFIPKGFTVMWLEDWGVAYLQRI